MYINNRVCYKTACALIIPRQHVLMAVLFLLVFQKKEWLCLNCQTQRALSGSLGDTPAPVAQPVGSPRPPATANQQPPQQKGPNQLLGPRPTGPQQQQKPPGPQVSGPVSPVKHAGPTPHPKGPSQAPPQTKGSAQPVPKGSTQPPSQTKGPTQPSAQSKGPQNKGPNQSHAQSKGPVQSANQIKGQSQAKGPAQAKGSAQPSAQTKGPSPGAKATPGKAAPNHTKASPTPSKTAPAQSKPTGNNQARKQPQSQEKTKVTSKALKEDVKASPKKALSETVTSPKDMKIVEDTQKSRHHEVSYLQLLRLHLLLLIHHYSPFSFFFSIQIIVNISHHHHHQVLILLINCTLFLRL